MCSLPILVLGLHLTHRTPKRVVCLTSCLNRGWFTCWYLCRDASLVSGKAELEENDHLEYNFYTLCSMAMVNCNTNIIIATVITIFQALSYSNWSSSKYKWNDTVSRSSQLCMHS